MLLPARQKNMVDVNVLGTMLLTREVAKKMALHRTGRIVFFGSMASFLNPSGDAVYAITKVQLWRWLKISALSFSA